jgi:hypothetical protein
VVSWKFVESGWPGQLRTVMAVQESTRHGLRDSTRSIWEDHLLRELISHVWASSLTSTPRPGRTVVPAHASFLEAAAHL